MLASRSALFAGVLSAGILGVTGAKKVNYDFTSGSLPSGVTVSRNQSAGYVNSSGVYAYAAVDTARFDHTSAGVMRGLMVEPMTSNLMQQSKSLTTSPWATSAVTVTGGYASYDGTNTAFLVAPTTTNTWHDLRQTSMSFVGKNVVVSAIVKASGYRYFSLGVTNSVTTWSSECSIVLDTTTGTVGLKSNTNYTLNSSGAISVGNGFWLVWANINVSYTTLAAIYCAPTPNSNGTTGSYAGNGSGAIVAAFQVEPARSTTSKPSGLITTTTAAVQRPPELVSFTIPAGVKALLFTFDDGTTQQLFVSPGAYTIPTNLCNGRRIKTIVDVNVTYDGPSIYLETDMSSDVGDLFGLQMLIYEANAGKCRIVGVSTNTHNDYSAPMVAAVLKHAGYGYVPVGAYQGSADPAAAAGSGYTQQIAARFGNPSETRTNYPDAVTLMRQVLAGRANGSVTLVSIGLFTNLAALLASAADGYSTLTGTALVAAKVTKFVAMAGYAAGGTEWNFAEMPQASHDFVAGLPSSVPSYYFGYELGSSSTFSFPIGDGYSSPFVYGGQLAGGSGERLWDLEPLMYASNGSFISDFNIAQANGTMTVDASTGANAWSSSPAGTVNYMGLTVSQATVATHVTSTVYDVS